MRALATTILALMLAACSATLDDNPTPRCDDGGTCGPGLWCDRGFCIDGNLDGGLDGALACTEESVCPPATPHCDHGVCRAR